VSGGKEVRREGRFNFSPKTLSAGWESSLKFGGLPQILKKNKSVSPEQLHSCDTSLKVSKYFHHKIMFSTKQQSAPGYKRSK
jgi:hypothetical protein